jgi:hypothetical protein
MVPSNTTPTSRAYLRVIQTEDSGHVVPAAGAQRLTLSRLTLLLAVERSLRDIVRLNLPLIV